MTQSQSQQQEPTVNSASVSKQMPLLNTPAGETIYKSWKYVDFMSLQSTLPIFKDGAGSWIRMSESLILGINLALGDIRAILAASASAAVVQG